MSIPKHSLLSGKPPDCSIDIRTDKDVQTNENQQYDIHLTNIKTI
jgi:hypothetical protein